MEDKKWPAAPGAAGLRTKRIKISKMTMDKKPLNGAKAPQASEGVFGGPGEGRDEQPSYMRSVFTCLRSPDV